MSKGIAIRTILYLLLGVLVVGILVYMVYTYTFGPELDMQTCRTKLINWCTGCKLAGWSESIVTVADDDIEKCISKHFLGAGCTITFPINCLDTCDDAPIDDTKIFCKQFTG